MEISHIFKNYTDQVSQIYLYKRAVKESARKEFEGLVQYEAQLNNVASKDVFMSLHNLFFRTAMGETPYFFDFKESSLEDKKIAVILHKNKQYHWLLAEAYEAFEDFIEEAYAFAGYKDKNFWPLNDFGSVSLSELDGKDFEWFVSRAKEKRDKPQSILSHFRDKFPQMQQREASNNLKVNLRLAIVLIENLRHLIVHRKGVALDKEKFIENVLKKSGLYNNGKFDIEHRKFIEKFFGSDAHINTISLLEIPTNPDIPIDTHIDVFELLGGYLLAYALLIARCFEMDNK